MSDPIYRDNIKVSAGPFTVKTIQQTRVAIERRHAGVWAMPLEDLALLSRAINEYLHMRSME